MASRPPLYRIWKAFGLLATLVVVVVVVVSATAVYSLFTTAAGGLTSATGSGGYGPTKRLTASLSGDAVVETLELSFPNHGYYAIADLTATGALVNATDRTDSVGTLGAPSTTIPPGRTANLTLTARVNLVGTDGPFLSTHNGSLASDLWLNWSYAYLYGFSVRANFSLPWTPPFGGLSYALSGVVAESNGSLRATLSVGFANAVLNLTLRGTLDATITAPGEADCGTADFPIVSGTGPVTEGETVWLAPGCPTSGDSVASVYVSNGDTLALPAEPLE